MTGDGYGTLRPEEGAFVRIRGTAGAVRLRALPAPEEDPDP